MLPQALTLAPPPGRHSDQKTMAVQARLMGRRYRYHGPDGHPRHQPGTARADLVR